MPAFEEIVDGQIPVDEWYDFKLDKLFPGIEANSELGKLALKLELDLVAADEVCDQFRENNIDDDSADEAHEKYDQIFFHHIVLKRMFNRVWQALAPQPSAAPSPSYRNTVAIALNGMLHEIDNYLCSDQEKALLANHAYDIADMYFQEELLQFRALKLFLANE